MRSTNERVAAVQRRAKALKQAKRVRGYRLLELSSIAASLLLIVWLGLAMPGMLAGSGTVTPLQAEGMASIFSAGGGMGFVAIALLAFTLGVCITLLCILLNHRAKEDAPHSAENASPHGAEEDVHD